MHIFQNQVLRQSIWIPGIRKWSKIFLEVHASLVLAVTPFVFCLSVTLWHISFKMFIIFSSQSVFSLQSLMLQFFQVPSSSFKFFHVLSNLLSSFISEFNAHCLKAENLHFKLRSNSITTSVCLFVCLSFCLSVTLFVKAISKW